MTFNWEKYFELASDLERDGKLTTDEARLRCAISRAYYAAFRMAGNFLEANGLAPQNGHDGRASHDAVVHVFERRRSHHPDYYKVSQKLKQMKRMRVRADYRNIFNDPHDSRSIGDLAIVADDALVASMEVILTLKTLVP